MQSYTSDQLRNVVLIGHGGSGKTTLAEAMLFTSGAISRMGSIEAHNTVSDYDELEHSHSYSISASLLAVEWAGHRINVIDAPGYADFVGEVVEGCAAADAAIITVDAASDVQAGTESAWEQANVAGLPRMFVIARLDRENSDFDAVLAALRERFGTKVVPLAVPDESAAGFSAVVDLLSEAPESAADAREMLVESVAETDDDLLNKYLEGEEIGHDELAAALATAVASGDVVPVFPASATGEVGVKELMDDVVGLLPSPLGREHALEDGSLTTDASGAVVAQVFKTTADPFVGRLTFMKVLRGTLTSDQNPYNVQRAATERLGHLFLHRGKEQIEVTELVAGDIGVAAKLAETLTGDTLVATEADAVTVPPIPLPVPTYRSTLHPRTKADVDKLSQALQRIMEQDPTIRMDRDPDTHEMVMRTIGDAQVNIATTRLEQTYSVAVDAELPRVPYRETISTIAKSEYKHKKQTGGHGQYGHVVIEIAPLTRGDGVEFEHKVVGGNVPRQFIPAVQKGVNETLPDGPLANSPIVDVKVTLLDGSAHSVDSSEMSFKIATAQALKQGILDARPVLLEPVMNLSIRVPSDHVGDVMGDLNTRRGQVHGVEPDGIFSKVDAEAPLAEVQRYSTDLRAITQGRGSFAMEFDRYVEVPGNVQEQVLKLLATAAEVEE
ncbi:MAG: elongation factor G [Dehalococcoidia bacterium]|jgi:elongation factor G|nr:elongation factor G [Dehalococcoidia bacterium]